MTGPIFDTHVHYSARAFDADRDFLLGSLPGKGVVGVCEQVTHNMHQALELGNRTLMMDSGRIVFDVKGEERSRMTVDGLLEKFRENAGKNLDNDRILLSKVEK